MAPRYQVKFDSNGWLWWPQNRDQRVKMGVGGDIVLTRNLSHPRIAISGMLANVYAQTNIAYSAALSYPRSCHVA